MFATFPFNTRAHKIAQYKCRLCGLDFSTAEELRTHNRWEHSRNVHYPAGIG
jgi:hypothetical protein